MGIRFKIKQILFLFLLGYASIPLYSVSFFLKNDSRFPLNAQVLDNLGRQLAIIPLAPGQMYLYDIDQPTFSENTNEPYTPFTVIFLCRSARPYNYQETKHKKGEKAPAQSKYVDQFGVWTGVPRGALVTALGSPTGTKSCIIKKNKDSKETHIPNRVKNFYNGNSWSNDGGENWTNDSGSGYKECIDGDVNCYDQVKTKKTRENEQREIDARKAEQKAKEQRKRKKGFSSFGSWSSDGKESFESEAVEHVQENEDLTEEELTDQSGEWKNDGGESFDNDDDETDLDPFEKPEKKPVKKSPAPKAGHTPTRHTPLPFTPVN